MHLNIAPFPPYQPVLDPLLGRKPDRNGICLQPAPIQQAILYLQTWASFDQDHWAYVNSFLLTPGIDSIQVAKLDQVYPEAEEHQVAAAEAGSNPMRFLAAIMLPATNPDYRSVLGPKGWAIPSAMNNQEATPTNWSDPASIYNYYLGVAFQHNLNVGYTAIPDPKAPSWPVLLPPEFARHGRLKQAKDKGKTLFGWTSGEPDWKPEATAK